MAGEAMGLIDLFSLTAVGHRHRSQFRSGAQKDKQGSAQDLFFLVVHFDSFPFVI
jgi:hypothetical protein